LFVCCLLVLWHPSAPVGRRHDNVLPSVAAIAIYRNPVTWVMRSVEAFSQSFHESPARPLTAPRPCAVDTAPCAVVAAGRTGTGVSLCSARYPDAVEPGFHCARTHWIGGFMAFKLARSIRTVMLMVPV